MNFWSLAEQATANPQSLEEYKQYADLEAVLARSSGGRVSKL